MNRARLPIRVESLRDFSGAKSPEEFNMNSNTVVPAIPNSGGVQQ